MDNRMLSNELLAIIRDPNVDESDAVEDLLSQGADPNFIFTEKFLEEEKRTPLLHEALKLRKKMIVISLLNQPNINVDIKDEKKRTALISAVALMCSEELVALIL